MPAANSNTVYGIIADAMYDAGYLQEGAVPNSEQLSAYARRFCDIINLWQTQGLKLFLLKDIAIPLVAGKQTYRLGPDVLNDIVMDKPLQVLDGYVLTTSNVRRPLVGLSWNEWTRLSQVTGNDSTISSYFVDKQATYLDVHFWNTPDILEAANTAHLVLRTQAHNPWSLEEDVSFPQEWRIALRWGLADDIATGQPQAIMDRCAMRAKVYREALENWDVEDVPTRMTPDSRNNTEYGKFSQ